MDCNTVCLAGKFVSSGSLRYSPAGIPITEFRLFHSSAQIEGGTERKIEFEIGGMAVADIAIALSGLKTGNPIRLEGFLAKRSPKSGELVFHTTHFELIG
ncbi:MAG: primosomal replication protein N [Burkholderiales bacterium]